MRSAVFAIIFGFTGIAATPVAVIADDRDQRYYDRDARDYHEWNENENRAWHQYREERHLENRDFNRARQEEQREYWRWRHQHERRGEDRDRDRD